MLILILHNQTFHNARECNTEYWFLTNKVASSANHTPEDATTQACQYKVTGIKT
jgi:hypothetical protein